jgi:predicted Zn-dependent protease
MARNAHLTAIRNLELQGYIDGIRQRIAAHFPDYNLPYLFTPVTESLSGSTHEPAAFPGGYVFVSAKLILAARDEAEFAGMVAHSMAHMAGRHSVRIASAQAGLQSAIPLMFMVVGRDWETRTAHCFRQNY